MHLTLRALPTDSISRICLRLTLATIACVAPFGVFLARAEPTTWEQWQRVVGVVDIGGPRSDGDLVVMANGRLFLISPTGTSSPIWRWPRRLRGTGRC